MTKKTNHKPKSGKKGLPASPVWDSSTKLVVAAAFVIVIAGLLIFFRGMLGPLLLAFVLVYLFYPLADRIHKKFHLHWRLSVALIYVVFVLVLLGLLVWGGFTIVDQAESLFNFLEIQMEELPDFLTNLGKTRYQIGPIVLDFQQLDLQIDQIVTQVVNSLTSVVSTAGSMAGTVASGALNLIANAVLVLLVSFFMLSESNGVASQIVRLNIPNYQTDIEKMGKELNRVWDAFLRGQLTLILITIVLYTIVLGILGLPYAIGLALLAGLARFLPYVGPAILWVVLFSVSIFNELSGLGLNPFWYAMVVVGIGLVVDTMIDQLITPKLMGTALRVHPAALLIGFYVGASLLGFVGIMLASPMLATVKLFAEYALHKTLDQDPWQALEEERVQQQTDALPQLGEKLPTLWEQINSWLWNNKK